jgi:hypothetical protein
VLRAEQPSFGRSDCLQTLTKPCLKGCFCENALGNFIGCKPCVIWLAADFLLKVRETLHHASMLQTPVCLVCYLEAVACSQPLR